MAEFSAIGIKKLYYGTPVASVAKPYKEGDNTTGLSAKEVKTLLPSLTEVLNVHQDTWSYEEAEATITRYKNQLTDKPYRQDVESGEVKIGFTIGKYDFNTKAALQGGTASETSWSRPMIPVDMRKTIVALTNDDYYIIFSNAAIIGRGALADKAIGLAVSATPMESSVVGLEAEKWFAKSAVDSAV